MLVYEKEKGLFQRGTNNMEAVRPRSPDPCVQNTTVSGRWGPVLHQEPWLVEAADVFQEQREGLLSFGMLCPGHTGSVSNLEKGKYFTILISGGSNENSSDIWILAALLVELFGEGLRGVACWRCVTVGGLWGFKKCELSAAAPAPCLPVCLRPCCLLWWSQTHLWKCKQASIKNSCLAF